MGDVLKVKTEPQYCYDSVNMSIMDIERGYLDNLLSLEQRIIYPTNI